MAHVDNLRRHFPAVRTVAYLNTGTYGALPDVTIHAMKDALDLQVQNGRRADEYLEELMKIQGEVREHLASLLSVKPSEIALTDSTTHGINVVLWGLPLTAGDEIIYMDSDHQGSLLPVFIQKHRRGVVLKKLRTTLSDEALFADLQANFSPRTRAVVVPHVASQTGLRMPIERIAQMCREQGAFCLVNGAQGAGAEQLSLEHGDIDFYSMPGQKWLCGPDGTGAVYIHSRLHSVLGMTYTGAASLEEYDLYNDVGDFIGARSARRFEHSRTGLDRWTGLLESLKFLRVQVGWDYAQTRIHGLTGYVIDQLLDIPHVHLLTPRDRRVGLVSFKSSKFSSSRIVQDAHERAVDVRYIREQDVVRVSCGFYNTEDDVQRLINLLKG